MLTKYSPARNSIVYVELYIYEAIYMNCIIVTLVEMQYSWENIFYLKNKIQKIFIGYLVNCQRVLKKLIL